MLRSRFYPIIDPSIGRHDPLALTAAVLAGGARLLQLRMKDGGSADFVAMARAVKKLTDAAGADLIINDRADIAELVDAAGVHLGQHDLPAEAARALLGSHRLIGVSTHTLAQALAAEAEGSADYLGFGPVFATATKQNPDPVQGVVALAEVCRTVRLPVVAIGGIDCVNVAEVLATGAAAIAVIGDIAHASDPEAQAKRMIAICNSR